MTKQKKTEKRPIEPKHYDHLDDTFTNACSPTDCTGLISHAPLTEEEFESFSELYDFQPPYEPSEMDTEGTGPFYGSDHTRDHIR